MCPIARRHSNIPILILPILVLLAFLQGCASASRPSQTPPPPESIAIMTTSLPAGQINVAYSTTLAATGGTSPFTWTLTSGALPTGLLLNASTGAIAGTPTVSVTSSPLTFQVKDSSTPQQTKSVSLTLTIGTGGTLTVSLTPVRGGATVTQQLQLTATVTNDVGGAGVTWTVSAG